ncbi:acyloxyacyl hydrolase [Bowmanella dokdonensis]|uniref:Acyloxyacyl hydrolase n=1 Tax=Bowmanella dokdonensis TaxID=751969 RepID=A0A939DP54_9ALTE|nr:acyloxyacyl hydrolase [Bowmanella dokdonensis]MBN7826384.1 acyloxyacyl hydrolase [Bowmanella dokdonensis]
MNNVDRLSGAARLLAGLAWFIPCLYSSAPAAAELMLYQGRTLFANQDTRVSSVLLHYAIQGNEWLDGVLLSYGQFDGVYRRSDNQWYSVGAYWQFWQQGQGYFEFEFAPTYLRHRFMAGHFVGSNWHFTSALSYNYRLESIPLTLALRYQHTSNGGVSHPNPGIDALGISARYRF